MGTLFFFLLRMGTLKHRVGSFVFFSPQAPSLTHTHMHKPRRYAWASEGPSVMLSGRLRRAASGRVCTKRPHPNNSLGHEFVLSCLTPVSVCGNPSSFHLRALSATTRLVGVLTALSTTLDPRRFHHSPQS